MIPRVLFLSSRNYPFLGQLRQRLPANGLDVHFVDAEVEARMPSAEVLSQYQVLLLDTLVKRNHLAVLEHMKSLRWIHTLLAGVEEIPRGGLPSNVPLTNSRGVYKNSLAEFALFSMLYFAKSWARIQRQQRERKWVKFDCDELTGKTVAIIAYGAIGQATALRARAHGMRVIATRRNPDIGDAIVDKMYGPQDTAAVMSMADFVVCCAPLTPETRLMIGEREIRSMKKNAVFINMGRGWVVDELALINALKEERILGAALDVFHEEPLPESSPLWEMENVLLSPHCTDNTRTWRLDACNFFLDNWDRYLKQEPLLNIVDKEAGY